MNKLRFADKMRDMQQSSDFRLPENSYIILQLDGKAFHTWTRGLKVPFDSRFVDGMNEVALKVASTVSNIRFGYVQSDEINLVMTDLGSERTQPYHANRVQKIVSTSAGLASAVMSRLFPDKDFAVFDARMFVAPTVEDVTDWFNWRQTDAIKNSVRAVGYARFSHKDLMGKNTQEVREMLAELGDPWEAYSDGEKFGRMIVREEEVRNRTFVNKRTGLEETVEFVSNDWVAKPAQLFKTSDVITSRLP